MRLISLVTSRWMAAVCLIGTASALSAPHLWIRHHQGPARQIAVGNSFEDVEERLGRPDFRASSSPEGVKETWYYFWPDSLVRRALARSPLTARHPAFDRSRDTSPMAVFWFDESRRVVATTTP